MSVVRTVAEAREWFEVTGQTVTQWSLDHGFSPSVVYALLSGRTRGRRGDAHRAAVVLGLKPDVATKSPAERSWSTSDGKQGERAMK